MPLAIESMPERRISSPYIFSRKCLSVYQCIGVYVCSALEVEQGDANSIRAIHQHKGQGVTAARAAELHSYNSYSLYASRSMTRAANGARSSS